MSEPPTTVKQIKVSSIGHVMKIQSCKAQISPPLPVATKLASVLILCLLGASAYAETHLHGDEGLHRNRPSNVPAGLEVPAGNKLAFHASGLGAQIYVWTVNPSNPALSAW